MTADHDELLPIPEFPAAFNRFVNSSLGHMKREAVQVAMRTMLREYARANLAAQRTAFRHDNARLRRSLNEAIVHGNRQSAKAERLEAALRTARALLVGHGHPIDPSMEAALARIAPTTGKGGGE